MTGEAKMSGNDGATAGAMIPGDFGWALATVLRGYQLKFDEAVGTLPGGVRGFQVLSTVVHRDPENQQALGSHLGIDRTVLTYLLDELVEESLVERVPSPSDRRARKIVITDNGRQVLESAEERVAGFEAELLESLDEDAARELFVTIRGLAMDVHRSRPGVSACEAIDHLI